MGQNYLDGFYGLFKLLDGARNNDNIGSFLCELAGHGPAHALRATSDHRRLQSQVR